MKPKSILSFFFILSIANATAQIDSFPSYKAVLHRFFSSYAVDSFKLISVNHLHFARKPSGWTVQIKGVNSKNIVLDEPIWENAFRSWKPLSAYFAPLKKPSDSSKQIDRYMEDSIFYDINLYYGYQGWERDVIDLLRPMESELQGKQLYQLARAYSAFADFILWPGRFYHNEFLRFDSTLSPADIDTGVVRAFTVYKDSAIRLYKRILDKNKNYTTPLGNIGTVYSNEFVNTYFQLTMVNQKDPADKYLVDQLYDPFTLSYFRNVLLGCDSNAVLFTTGDDEAYATLYLQEHLGVRKDVTIVVRELLSYGRYINYITNLIPEAKRLHSRLPIDFYKPDKPLVHFLTKEDLLYGNANEFISNIAGNWKNEPTDSLVTADVPVILHFPMEGNKDKGRLFTWTLAKKDHLLKEDVFFADFFCINDFRRPLYFIVADFGLEDYCRFYGLTYSIFPRLFTKADSLRIGVKNYRDIIHNFTYARPDPQLKYNSTVLDRVDWYGTAFYTIAQSLIDTDADSLAIKVLDKYFELFPDTLIHFNPGTFYVVQLFYYAHENAKGDYWTQILAGRLAEDFSENMKDEKNNVKALRDDLGTIYDIIKLMDDFERPAKVKATVRNIKNYMIMHATVGMP